jgi:hypothetical protein
VSDDRDVIGVRGLMRLHVEALFTLDYAAVCGPSTNRAAPRRRAFSWVGRPMGTPGGFGMTSMRDWPPNSTRFAALCPRVSRTRPPPGLPHASSNACRAKHPCVEPGRDPRFDSHPICPGMRVPFG